MHYDKNNFVTFDVMLSYAPATRDIPRNTYRGATITAHVTRNGIQNVVTLLGESVLHAKDAKKLQDAEEVQSTMRVPGGRNGGVKSVEDEGKYRILYGQTRHSEELGKFWATGMLDLLGNEFGIYTTPMAGMYPSHTDYMRAKGNTGLTNLATIVQWKLFRVRILRELVTALRSIAYESSEHLRQMPIIKNPPAAKTQGPGPGTIDPSTARGVDKPSVMKMIQALRKLKFGTVRDIADALEAAGYQTTYSNIAADVRQQVTSYPHIFTRRGGSSTGVVEYELAPAFVKPFKVAKSAGRR